MELPDEPKGWRILQTIAQNEKDPKRLEAIINQMNRLLDQHESEAENREFSARESRRRRSESITELGT